MIKFERSSSTPPYASKGVLIHVTHMLKISDIEEILKAYMAERGKEELEALVRELLPTSTQFNAAVQKPFYCFVQGGATPQMQHMNAEVALAEAQRLAKQTNKETYVMQRVYTVTPEVTFKVKQP